MIEGSSYQGKNCNKCMLKIYAGEINFSSSYQESTVFVLIWVHASPSYGYYPVNIQINHSKLYQLHVTANLGSDHSKST